MKIPVIPPFAIALGAAVWAAASLTVANAHANPPAVHEHFPDELAVEHGADTVTLALTGHAIRRKFRLEIYHLAHYRAAGVPLADVERVGELVFDDILAGEELQQISMVFKRDVKARQIQNALWKGVERNCQDGEFEQVKADLVAFSEAISQDASKDDRFTMRWLPTGRLVSIYQGKRISQIDSPLLARLLWSMWFGDRAVVDRYALVEHVGARRDAAVPSSAPRQLALESDH